jgi:hypothetical protein
MISKKKLSYFAGIFFILLSAIHLYAGSNSQQQAPKKLFQAGAATTNTSPPMDIEMRSSPAIENIHDELHARCLVLDDGENRIAFVVVDIIGLNRDLIDEAKRIIHEENDLPPENVMVSATHTHSMARASGPQPFDDYQKFVIRRIADAARKAIYNLEPARIGWGVGSVPEHVFVRRWFMKPGSPVPNPYGGEDKVMMNPGRLNPNIVKPAGEPDPEVSIISVQSIDGKPIALFANYSLHYVGGVPRGHISADYFAAFADRIQELLGADRNDPPFVGIMSNGTSGDVNNINYAVPGHNYPPYARMKVVADDVAREVMRVYNKINHHDWAGIQSKQQELTLKVRKPDSKMIKHAREVLAGPDKRVGPHGSSKHYNEGLLNRLDMPDNVDILLQSFKIGDLAIATIPFETFAEIGLEIKAKSKFKPTFTVSLANGSYGYLPTPRQHEWGGYETWTNRFEYEASVKIVDTIMNLFETFE